MKRATDSLPEGKWLVIDPRFSVNDNFYHKIKLKIAKIDFSVIIVQN